MGEVIEEGDGLAALRPQLIHPIQHISNPLLSEDRQDIDSHFADVLAIHLLKGRTLSFASKFIRNMA